MIKDQHGNQFEMSDTGISMNSASNINLKASEEVKIEGMNITIRGEQVVDVSSSEVTVTGDVSTSIYGSAECTISSDGNLSAKGLMVMIN